MLDFKGVNELVGTADMLALGRRYDPGPRDAEERR
jgi:hypothetical protein